MRQSSNEVIVAAIRRSEPLFDFVTILQGQQEGSGLLESQDWFGPSVPLHRVRYLDQHIGHPTHVQLP